MRGTKTIALLAALALCAGTLSACGNKNPDETQTTTTAQVTENAAATQSADTKTATTAASTEAASTAAPTETTPRKLIPEGDTPSFTLPSGRGEGSPEQETQAAQPSQPAQPTQPTQPGGSTTPSESKPASGEDLVPIADSNENLP